MQAVEQKIMVEQCMSFCRFPREVDIVSRYYGIGREKQTLREIADDYGLTHERIRQIRCKALRRMKAGVTKELKREIMERERGL